VSFAFIDKIIPFREAAYKYVLVASWACFAAALVFSVIIHLAGSFIHGKYCDIIKENTRRAYDGTPPLEYNKWYMGRIMPALYTLDFIGFLGGMVCLVGFVFFNA
jgi:hypothetical protein